MKATSSAEAEFAKGRTPREMSRPMTTTRAGFMESHGAGIQILMSADVALEMGVPIYAIVALSSVASDKEGRSVPAPGQGILTTAKETRGSSSPLLDLQYRRQAMESERERLLVWRKNMLKGPLGTNNPEFVDREYERMLKASQSLWGNEFFKNDPAISPLRGALNVFGLGIDDIHIASFHGTSTQANDYNESSVIQQQMEHLGRTKVGLLSASSSVFPLLILFC
jgi:fatty acid synthase subunit alpha